MEFAARLVRRVAAGHRARTAKPVRAIGPTTVDSDMGGKKFGEAPGEVEVGNHLRIGVEYRTP